MDPKFIAYIRKIAPLLIAEQLVKVQPMGSTKIFNMRLRRVTVHRRGKKFVFRKTYYV